MAWILFIRVNRNRIDQINQLILNAQKNYERTEILNSPRSESNMLVAQSNS